MARIEVLNDDKPEIGLKGEESPEDCKAESNVVELVPYKKFNPVSFPSNLESDPRHKNYLIFTAVEHDQTKLGAMVSHGSMKEKQTKFMDRPNQVENTIGMIRMYMPNLNENYAHDYGSSSTSIFTELASKLQNVKTSDGLFSTLSGALEAGTGVLRDRAAQELQKSDAVTQITGMRQLQNHVALYKGTNLREQTFMFVLRPKNTKELQDIGNIIYNFRMHSAGVSRKTTFGTDKSLGTIQLPPLWYIEERLKQSSGITNRFVDTFMMGPAVITNVRVNKTPDQIYQSVAGTSGDPISIELEITFKEIVPVYRQFWESLSANRGRVVTDSPSLPIPNLGV